MIKNTLKLSDSLFSYYNITVEKNIKTNKDSSVFYIIEVNSAPGMGELTFENYRDSLLEIIKFKKTNT
mgnify:CR=1 FL=1